MNLQLIPKYKKFNKPLNQVFVVSVPASFRESPGHLPGHEEPYKQKKNRKPRGRVRIGSAHIVQEEKSAISRLFRRKKNTTESSSEAKDCNCLISRWWAKRKALNKLKAEHKHRAEQAERWRIWKEQEAKRIEEAKRQDAYEQARREREAEYMRQIQEIEEQKRKMAKDSLKTSHPYPVEKRTLTPKESFSRNLPTEPSCPKPVEYEPTYDYDNDRVVAPKVNRLQNRKEIKKKQQAEKQEIKKKKQAEKREAKKKKQAEMRETKKKKRPEKIKKVKDIPLYKQKITKTKKQKIKKTDLVKRKSFEHSQRFVDCFYKTCCACYCWLTIFLAIGVLIIMVV